METILVNFESALAYVVPMVVLLGLLIFVHELGHFLVAKYFKVRVEVFSLGFGPKLLKIRRGDTTYAISAVPLGGYVKMFGDDPSAEINEADRNASFLHKPVMQRIGVVLAGPIMNFLFAILVFGVVASIGEPALAPKIGDLAPASAAAIAGFQTGDVVIDVAGEPVRTWEEMQRQVEANPNKLIQFTVERSGQRATVTATPKLTANKNIMSWSRSVGEIEGLSYASKSTFVGLADTTSAAFVAGLRTGDMIKSIDGVATPHWRDVIRALDEKKNSVVIEVERGALDEKRQQPETLKFTVAVAAPLLSLNGSEKTAKLGIEYPELYLASMEKKSPAERAGLAVGDRLLSIDGEEVRSFEHVASIIRTVGENSNREAKKDGEAVQPLLLKVARDGKEMAISVTPDVKMRMNAQGKEERKFEIGIRPLILDALPATTQLKAGQPLAAIARGFEQTLHWTSLTVLSFVRLAQHEVSPKNIGGFLSIGQMAKKSWQIGASQFLNIMAIISINLFVLNLLPIPVLDGGHLVFYTIEAIKGAPLSMKKMEIAQQVGLVLLLGLMMLSLFNDVTRLFN